jgi:hypothetical protein
MKNGKEPALTWGQGRLHFTENPIYVFPETKLRGLPGSVTYLAAEKYADRSWEYKN